MYGSVASKPSSHSSHGHLETAWPRDSSILRERGNGKIMHKIFAIVLAESGAGNVWANQKPKDLSWRLVKGRGGRQTLEKSGHFSHGGSH